MKKIIFSFYILSMFACCNQKETPAVKKYPGSFSAMQLMSFQRSYPNGDIPSNGFISGYEQHTQLKKNQSTKRSISDQWESQGPFNIAGRVLSVAINPQADSTLYAGSASGGLWRSRKLGMGVSWERVNTGFPVLGVSDIEFAPGDSSLMFIGTGEVYNYETTGTDGAYRPTRGSYGIGILKSTDGGRTWTKSLDWSLQNERGVWMIKIDPKNTQNVYAATTDGIYKSNDQGDSWEKVLDVLMATDLEIHPERPNEILISCGNLFSEGRGIYKSVNGGLTWDKLGDPIVQDFGGKIQLAYAPSNPDIVLASIGNTLNFSDGATWLYRSEDFGDNWTLISETDYSRWQGWFSHDVSIHPNDPEDIVAVGIAVWRWNKQLADLEQRSSTSLPLGTPPIGGQDGSPFYSHPDHHFVMHHPTIDNLVILGNDGGVFLSPDGGDTYITANGGMQTTQFYNGFSVNSNGSLALGGLQDNNTVVFSDNPAWRRVIGGDGSWTALNPLDNDILYGSFQNLGVRKSMDGGNSFEGIGFPSPHTPVFIAPYVLAPSDPDRMYFGSSTVFRSDDGGETTFNLSAVEGIINNPIYAMEVSPMDKDVLYCATAPFPNGQLTQEPEVIVTLDGGLSFIKSITDLPNRIINDITVDPVDPAVAYLTLSGFGSAHLFKTIDFGQTWFSIDNGIPDIPGNAIIVNPNNSDQLYYGNDIGVYLSNDGGGTWQPWDEGLPNACIVLDLKIAEEDGSVWIATHGNGSYKRPLDGEVVAATELLLEDIQIYPNPSSNWIRLNRELPVGSSYRIFDFSGRVVLEGTLSSNELNISSFPSGKYNVQLKTKNAVFSGNFIKS